MNPAAISAPLSPSARSRSGPSANVVVSSDSAAGMTAAVASPWPARAASSSAGESARPPTSEETPSSAIPSRNNRRRPNRSAIRPNSSVKPAAQSANDVAIHCRCDKAETDVGPDHGQRDVEDREVDREGEARGQQDREREALTWHATHHPPPPDAQPALGAAYH